MFINVSTFSKTFQDNLTKLWSDTGLQTYTLVPLQYTARGGNLFPIWLEFGKGVQPPIGSKLVAKGWHLMAVYIFFMLPLLFHHVYTTKEQIILCLNLFLHQWQTRRCWTSSEHNCEDLLGWMCLTYSELFLPGATGSPRRFYWEGWGCWRPPWCSLDDQT